MIQTPKKQPMDGLQGIDIEKEILSMPFMPTVNVFFGHFSCDFFLRIAVLSWAAYA